MDADLTISIVALAIVALNGASVFLALSIRDRVGAIGKRRDAQMQRVNRLIEWLEGGDQGKKKRRDARH